MATFLLKTEPTAYSYDDLEREGRTGWTGVRNATAQIHLRKIALGDQLFIYHSVKEKQIVGIAKALSGPGPDETDSTGKYIKVDIAPVKKLKKPITLAEFKEAGLGHFDLVRMSRLSVMPVPDDVLTWIQARI